jgi:hypothetical protein
MLCPETLGLSLPRTTGITDHTNLMKDKELQPKTFKSRRFLAFEGPRSSTKRQKALTHDPLKEIQRKPSQIRGINRRMKTPKRHQKDPQKSQRRIFYTTKKHSYNV